MGTSRTLTVALVGNPNTGKSTLFNALTGLRQHVGNYPGVTVEMKKGTARVGNGEAELHLIDLPGTYSLAPRSPDEMVSVDLLLGHIATEPRPDVVVSIVDASNLERHLYLTTQLMELGVPVVLAVNLIDVAKRHGIEIDYPALEARLGVPVVPVQANKEFGLDGLLTTVLGVAGGSPPQTGPLFPDAFRQEVGALRPGLGDSVEPYLAARLLLDVGGHTEKQLVGRIGPGLVETVTAARARLSEAGCPIPAVEARTRYGWIRQIAAGVVRRPAQRPDTWRDRLDRVLTHKVWGTLIFFVLMFLLFEAIFVGAKPIMDLIRFGFGAVGDGLKSVMGPGPFRSLLTDGVIAGVGGVLVFLPQILILFAVIAVLEDCGYMPRPFLMDKIMARCGLNGSRSSAPVVGRRAIPGIMATRVIENPLRPAGDVLVAPLMSCSPGCPSTSCDRYVPGRPWWLPGVALFGMYMIGFVTAPLVPCS